MIGISSIHSKNAAFHRSKAHVYGQIGPVTRARVSELMSFDPDRPAGPSQRVPVRKLIVKVFCHRHPQSQVLFLNNGLERHNSSEVQQRGIPGTAAILESVIEGMDLVDSRMYLLDLMPNRHHCCIQFTVESAFYQMLCLSLTLSYCRYNEWGLAAWSLQCKYLTSPGGHDWRYMAYLSGEDAEAIHLPEMKNAVVGKMMSVRILIC